MAQLQNEHQHDLESLGQVQHKTLLVLVDSLYDV